MKNDPYNVLPEQIDILVDEIEQASLANSGEGKDLYSQGYLDGLRMALDILWGTVE